jgi:hypothetical protein
MTSNPPSPDYARLLRRLRWMIGIFIVGLVVSGVTAFPLLAELEQIARVRGIQGLAPAGAANGFDYWILTVRDGLRESYLNYPWLAYGTDWLAFAHLIIAIFFLGPFLDPVRNVWVLQAGLIACVLVIPLALIAGTARQIPLGWQLIDCSFGVFGTIPLIVALRWTRALADLRSTPGNRPSAPTFR